jgi:SOS-response transcriptional repressor LexA
MEGLSPRQKEVYDCIQLYHDEHGISPSMADIANSLGLSNSTIATYIETLRKKKCVTSLPGIPRSLKVVPA